MTELMTISEAAPKIFLSKISLRRLIKKKLIGYRIIGNRYYFSNIDLENYLASVYHPAISKGGKNDSK